MPADPDGVLLRLVSGVGLFAGAPLPRWALIGGVAVMVHLTEAHRATHDVDAVADDDAGDLRPALAVLSDAGPGTARDPSIVLTDGTKVEAVRPGL